MGNVFRWQYSGSVDAAVVSVGPNFQPTNINPNGNIVFTRGSSGQLRGDLPRNALVTGFGHTSRGWTGVITNTGRTITTQTGVRLTNIVQINRTLRPGDSGGPVTFTSDIGGFRFHSCVGIAQGSTATHGYYVDMDRIRAAFGFLAQAWY
jgi:hypothetical protein